MWDERYSSSDYAYGKHPNAFLMEKAYLIPKGKVLCIGEGEGRNAVYLAKLGYEVTAVDSSSVGLQKAQALAHENGVSVSTIHADLAEFDFGEEKWDSIVSIYVPLPSLIRKRIYSNMHSALKMHGVFLLEAFTPSQIGKGTGGGNNPDTMQTTASVKSELSGFVFEFLQEIERDVLEGSYHTGNSSVVKVVAVKL